MSERFVSNWWSVRIPLGWQAEESEECVSFSSYDGVGALQISAYRNGSGIVTEDDLSEFALSEVREGRNLVHVSYGTFKGLEASYFEAEWFRKVCWLREQDLMIYATYLCSAGDESVEIASVDELLKSLQPVLPTSAAL